MGQLTMNQALFHLVLTGACVGILANTFHGDGEPLIASLAFSGIAFSATFCLIRWLSEAFVRAGLKGRDMAKAKTIIIPETMGAISAVVFLLTTITFIPFPFYKDIIAATSGGGNRDVPIIDSPSAIESGRFLHKFPHNKLASYLSAILSLQSIVLLGIGDDLFDIRWRHKVLIPGVASIPLLIVYFVDFGVTSIVVPTPLRPLLGGSWLLDLGPIYYVYMALLSIFCANSINILAGINGIEVAQSLVIAGLIMVNDMLYLPPFTAADHPAQDSHLFSLYMLLPFTGVSLALLWHNWYPARVFVGDTYCYFAGMVFATVGILGHFSKTLWLLFIPQAFNFVYSSPQLFKFVPCPRHRLPHFNRHSNLLEPSKAELLKPLPGLFNWGLKFLADLKLIWVKCDESGRVVEFSNMTILNLWLVWRGPLREDRLALEVVMLQIACGILGLVARHRLALLIFDTDNL